MPLARGVLNKHAMSWVDDHGLATRLANLPLILAGPMLRKVTRRSVSVWLALREERTVQLHIRRLPPAPVPPSEPIVPIGINSSVPTGTTRIGVNLHLVVVTAEFPESMEADRQLHPGHTYLYDLDFTADGETFETLAQALAPPGTPAEELPTAASKLAYGALPLPSFAMPPTALSALRLVHGSCRKPTGPGTDALLTLDDMIRTAIVEEDQPRPHQLVLSGDQIYADEVSDQMLVMLTDAARVLVDPHERLPIDPNDALGLSVWLPVEFPDRLDPTALLPRRRSLVCQYAGFSSHDTRSHLLSFGEYLAMYLFVWSDVLWPLATVPLPSIDEVYTTEITGSGQRQLEVLAGRHGVEVQDENVREMQRGMPAVRRALANVPTYMIFDDHEITDDWNISKDFVSAVYGKPLGMRIIQNGLLAYALCQHWGNCPEQFRPVPDDPAPPPAGYTLLTLLGAAVPSYNSIAGIMFLRDVVGLREAGIVISAGGLYHDSSFRRQLPDGTWVCSGSLLFHYTIEGPAHQIIVTDSRTWRSFPRDTGWGFPDLIDRHQLTRQLVTDPPPRNGRQFVVVMTTNIVPSPLIRLAGRDVPHFPSFITKSARHEDMADSWEPERIDFARLMKTLSRHFDPGDGGPRRGAVVFISGDVHTSSASRITYWADTQVDDAPGAPTGPVKLVVAQMIGSALRNGATDTRGQHVGGYGYVPPDAIKRFYAIEADYVEGFVGWNPAVVSAGTVIGERLFPLPGQEPGLIVNFHADRPTLSLRGKTREAWHDHFEETIEPHFRIRLDHLIADDSGRYHYDPPPLPPPTEPALRRKIAAMRVIEAVFHLREGVEMVGHPNIGEVRFSPGVATYVVHWRESGATEWVRYDMSLDLDDDRYSQVRLDGQVVL